MTINVYYNILQDRSPLKDRQYSNFYWQTKPEPLIKNMPSWWRSSAIKSCPATNDLIKNTYVLRFFHDYELHFDGYSAKSEFGNQEMLNSFLTIDDALPLIQITNSYVFFADKPLMVEIKHPYWHSNDFTRKASVISGEFDIGRWFRPFNTAAVLHDNRCSIKFNNDDISSYVTFKTDEKINLIEFKMDDKLEEYQKMASLANMAKMFKGPTPLKDLYTKFKYRNSRKHILKLINANLV